MRLHLALLPLASILACEQAEPPPATPVVPASAVATPPPASSSTAPVAATAARAPVVEQHVPSGPYSRQAAPPPPGRREVNGRCEMNPCADGDICVESHTGRVQVECLSGSFCGGAPTCACAGICGAGTCSSVQPAGTFANGAPMNARVTCSTGTLAP